MELLVDPVRAQIYFEILVKEEMTAHQMMKHLTIARSTLTHHLTKFVKAKVFNVRVESTGRPVKYYSLNKDFEEVVVIDCEDEETTTLQRRITFLESAAAHMQMIANLTKALARRTSEGLKIERSNAEAVSFVFSLLSEKEAAIWNKHHRKFLKAVESEIMVKIPKNESSNSPTHIAFSGLIPLPRNRD
ncbi:MAG: winged helix-turn-helix domain-containing protein [Candidatus Thorarchaeota archaeon]|jgi:predicted ArsR family transcriptional regulator